MNILIVLLSILVIVIVGLIVLKSFNLTSKKETLFNLSLSYGLGVGLISTQLFIYSRLNVEWTRVNILLPWIIYLICYLLYKRPKFNLNFKINLKFSVVKSMLLAGIIINFTYTAFQAIIRPVYAWDAWATWLLEAKVFFIDGTIYPEVFRYINSDYPLNFKLIGTYIYIMIGEVDDTSVLLISTSFLLFLGLAFYSILKNKFGATYALFFTFLLFATQNFVRHGGRYEAGLADLPLGFYFFLSAVLLIQYLKNQSWKTLLIFNLILGIAAVVKSEGLPFALMSSLLVIYHIFKKRLYTHLIIMLIWIIPYLDWRIYRKLNNLESVYFDIHPIEISLNKSINAFWGTIKELINIKSWNLLWITYIYLIVVKGIFKTKELTILNLLIIFQFSLYMIMYNFTYGNAPESSVERLLMHIAPLALLSVAIHVRILYPRFLKAN